MKKYVISTISILFSIIIITLINFINNTLTNNAQAYSNSGSTSDVQLIARAINGEARGEPYEGQVAVRCSNFK